MVRFTRSFNIEHFSNHLSKTSAATTFSVKECVLSSSVRSSEEEMQMEGGKEGQGREAEKSHSVCAS